MRPSRGPGPFEDLPEVPSEQTGARSLLRKLLFYDQRGYCQLVKRLDEGAFPIAHAVDSNAVEIVPSVCLRRAETGATASAMSLQHSS